MVREPIDRRPTLPGVVGGTAAAAVGGAMTVVLAPVSAPPVALGVMAAAAAGVTGHRRLLTVAAWLLGASLVGAAIVGGTPATAVAAGVLYLVAWDLLDAATVLGRQVGRATGTVRLEALRAGGTLLGGGVVAALTYGVFALAPGVWPLSALLLVLLAGAALLASIEL